MDGLVGEQPSSFGNLVEIGHGLFGGVSHSILIGYRGADGDVYCSVYCSVQAITSHPNLSSGLTSCVQAITSPFICTVKLYKNILCYYDIIRPSIIEAWDLLVWNTNP